ncbi:unnamed protein product [Symbiodinium natans]|uniref:Uncharacterized protein n=1 Tax=Symbiodinium natans TaxID=878477 RepID=A0A812TG75_9DINO|nr:unnamed protein product [Symbiodinium natans]
MTSGSRRPRATISAHMRTSCRFVRTWILAPWGMAAPVGAPAMGSVLTMCFSRGWPLILMRSDLDIQEWQQQLTATEM